MDEIENKPKKGVNIYIMVFGMIITLVVIAAVSTLIFNKDLAPTTLGNLKDYGPAPNITGVSQWINSPPLTMADLKGQVVLVDFWTYSCINCIRSIPYLEAWQQEYGNNGLVIIGVHTPEFQFEHNLSNVEAAVKQFNITYPVVLDNNYTIWNAYNNQYWPADYLIDKNGDVRYISIGEGNYNVTNEVIRELLENASYAVPSGQINITSTTNFSGIGTPELYVGYQEARVPLGNIQGFYENQVVNYTFTNITQNSTVYFSGEWFNEPDSMIAVNNQSKVFLIYKAKNVNVVASGTNSKAAIKLDGNNLPQDYLGADDVMLLNGTAVANVNASRLYNLIAGPGYNGWHEIQIDASTGFRLYTFTFG